MLHVMTFVLSFWHVPLFQSTARFAIVSIHNVHVLMLAEALKLPGTEVCWSAFPFIEKNFAWVGIHRGFQLYERSARSLCIRWQQRLFDHFAD